MCVQCVYVYVLCLCECVCVCVCVCVVDCFHRALYLFIYQCDNIVYAINLFNNGRITFL